VIGFAAHEELIPITQALTPFFHFAFGKAWDNAIDEGIGEVIMLTQPRLKLGAELPVHSVEQNNALQFGPIVFDQF
jgi:hypothetical protein